MSSIMRLLCGAAAVLTLCGAPVQSWAEDVPRFSQLSINAKIAVGSSRVPP